MKQPDNNHYKIPTKNGFTLVELIVVIVAIAIISAIAIITYNSISDRAKKAAMESNLVNIAKKLTVNQIESGTYPQKLDNFDAETKRIAHDLGYATPMYKNNLNGDKGDICVSLSSKELNYKVKWSLREGKKENAECKTTLVPIPAALSVYIPTSGTYPFESKSEIDFVVSGDAEPVNISLRQHDGGNYFLKYLSVRDVGGGRYKLVISKGASIGCHFIFVHPSATGRNAMTKICIETQSADPVILAPDEVTVKFNETTDIPFDIHTQEYIRVTLDAAYLPSNIRTYYDGNLRKHILHIGPQGVSVINVKIMVTDSYSRRSEHTVKVNVVK